LREHLSKKTQRLLTTYPLTSTLLSYPIIGRIASRFHFIFRIHYHQIRILVSKDIR